jgi:hypothetical protein
VQVRQEVWQTQLAGAILNSKTAPNGHVTHISIEGPIHVEQEGSHMIGLESTMHGDGANPSNL